MFTDLRFASITNPYHRCVECCDQTNVFTQLSSTITNINDITHKVRARLVYRVQHNIELIEEWKKHLLRTVHQDGARQHVLDILDDTSIFLVADWAMKWLPTRYREAQTRGRKFTLDP